MSYLCPMRPTKNILTNIYGSRDIAYGHFNFQVTFENQKNFDAKVTY